MIHTFMHNPDITIVKPGSDRLTAVNAKAFKDDISDVINAGGTRLVVDLNEVGFIDSSGLGALVGVLKKIGYHGELVLSGLNEDVAQMFKVCRMDRVFTSYPSVDAAVQKLAEAA